MRKKANYTAIVIAGFALAMGGYAIASEKAVNPPSFSPLDAPLGGTYTARVDQGPQAGNSYGWEIKRLPPLNFDPNNGQKVHAPYNQSAGDVLFSLLDRSGGKHHMLYIFWETGTQSWQVKEMRYREDLAEHEEVPSRFEGILSQVGTNTYRLTGSRPGGQAVAITLTKTGS
jgi:hypothetical protein